jgi:hypothetical protein
MKKKRIFSHKLLFVDLSSFALGLLLLLEKSTNSEEANGGHNNIIDMMITITTLEQQEKKSYPKENQARTREPSVAQKGFLNLLTSNSSKPRKDAHEKLNAIVDNHNFFLCSLMDFNYSFGIIKFAKC